MRYELTNMIRPGTANWEQQKQRLLAEGGQVLTLAPNPGFYGLLQAEGIDGINLIDWLTKRHYHADRYLFFNEIPTVSGAEIFMNKDRTISIISEGERIGSVILYANTRRAVKEVHYTNTDGTPDFVEEYTFDGGLYSRIFYTRGDVNEIVFYDESERPVIRYYFYDGVVNFVTVENDDGSVKYRYNSVQAFLTDMLGKMMSKRDEINITYMGLELNVLEKTHSDNSLYLQESPVDEDGKVKGNLRAILNNELPFIQTVKMDNNALQLIQSQVENTTKIDLI
ncbi:hypothetical protein FD04_GL002148 [Secundilactobacillus odoratitofui DSM 19909 = JCM 15043]|uniref:Uncharacterized protein n=1 Tax=Secundilactobacillus odoratitofui DSM 19909 = JCM 15043 TaxID=1423776 RepID=A0A0R1LYP2_9LACO|nr:hypothetical protein [Secundilactobacillus odoratitofui]KRK96871.1 hypothetical protein FD04_GL002148 [Secundilactobacillus odoratitofui DSM 19909 = JCM 15043]